MKELFEAIVTAQTGTALETALVGGLHLNEATQGASSPYCVYMLVSDVPQYTFDTVAEDVLIQFSLYAEHPAVLDIFDLLKAVYDDCRLAVAGYQLVNMEREFSRLMPDKDSDLYHYMVQYRIIIEKE